MCEGNSRKAIKQFWTHINKEKSTTIENISTLQDPITDKIHNNEDELMRITEDHLIRHFDASYT